MFNQEISPTKGRFLNRAKPKGWASSLAESSTGRMFAALRGLWETPIQTMDLGASPRLFGEKSSYLTCFYHRNINESHLWKIMNHSKPFDVKCRTPDRTRPKPVRPIEATHFKCVQWPGDLVKVDEKVSGRNWQQTDGCFSWGVENRMDVWPILTMFYHGLWTNIWDQKLGPKPHSDFGDSKLRRVGWSCRKWREGSMDWTWWSQLIQKRMARKHILSRRLAVPWMIKQNDGSGYFSTHDLYIICIIYIWSIFCYRMYSGY